MSVVLLLAAAAPLWVGRFSGEGPPPAPWQLVRVGKRTPPTSYRRARTSGVDAIEARANKSMALLARPMRLDLAATPILCWRWLVDAPVAAANLRTKKGDDYAARIYVAFDIPDDKLSAGTRMKLGLGRRMFGVSLPDAALNYVWDNKHAVGTRAKSAYTDRAELIVAESGDARAGSWVTERADIAADFARAFGGVPGSVTQLALASDTDNTGSSARAAFADLHFVGRSERCTVP